jgi:hypothetical protein
MESIRPPDFIVVGGHYGDKVYLLASKTLTEAELREDVEYPDIFDPRRTPMVDIRIVAGIKDYVWVVEDTYPLAWATLFAHWSPHRSEREHLTLEEFNQWELEG